MSVVGSARGLMLVGVVSAALVGSVGIASSGAVAAEGIALAPRAGPYRLATATLPDGSLVTPRWDPCQVTTYRINVKALTKSKRSGAVRDIKTAVGKLSAATGVAYSYRGTTSYLPTATNWPDRAPAELIISYTDPRVSKWSTTLLGSVGSSRAAGTGGYQYKAWSITGTRIWQSAIGRGYVVLNSRSDGQLSPGFGKRTTRGNLVLHELAHAVGLTHVGSKSQLMYPTMGRYTPNGYQSGDRAGLAAVGRAAGCIDVPTFVWSQI
ncbi:MAG: hypothetical protein WCI74_06570 [Actinomycetes bacterium]